LEEVAELLKATAAVKPENGSTLELLRVAAATLVARQLAALTVLWP
jgi:hypothetical protein